ncbi:hypothetical protein CPB84DRAFT_1242576 [Gymnopilus junonius]|uniref:F-box domain-containing protein n=1 Tax=Gymnopilus junonius TaxID=109634 RepID=A0A9P5NMD3_GYMJU|nr:hypothetical protein CPB84DRAFT_1242576 [Gymnopilus junonius]
MHHSDTDDTRNEAISDWRRRAVKEKIAQNESAAESTKATLRTLEIERYDLLEVLNSTSQIMTTLSPEVLSEIFIIACASGPSGSYRVPMQYHIGRVCKAWRRVAWSTPRLWCSVAIRFSEKRYGTQSVLLEEWIKRSGSCPLEITLVQSYSDRTWEPPVDSTLQYLLTTCHRWTKLDTYAFSTLAVALEQNRPQFPILKALYLGIGNVTRMKANRNLKNWTFYSATPQLCSLNVMNWVPGPQLGVNWGGLVELRTTLSFRFRPSLELLALLPSLESLYCNLEDYNSNFNSSSIPAQISLDCLFCLLTGTRN